MESSRVHPFSLQERNPGGADTGEVILAATSLVRKSEIGVFSEDAGAAGLRSDFALLT